MAIRLVEYDVTAARDADSGDAHAFTTYSGYWTCLAAHVERDFPTPRALLAELQVPATPPKHGSKPSSAEPQALRALLSNAWMSELALHMIPLSDTDRLWLANPWALVQSYYATSRAATAWITARNGSPPTTHARLLAALAEEVKKGKSFPAPWCCSCTSACDVAFANFPRAPQAHSTLDLDVDPWDRLGVLLRTTRDREVRRHVEVLKQKQKRKRAPNGERARQDARLPPTTVFDFAWRSRTRANYGDPALFYVGTVSGERAAELARSVRTWTSMTMLLFEALIAQKAPEALADAGRDFIDRDRGAAADGLLGDRLRAIRVL